MSVRITLGEEPPSIRAKAEQDRQAVRARIASLERDLLAAREQDRDIGTFLKTLDRYDPPIPKANPATLKTPAIHYGGGEAVDLDASASSLALNAATRNLLESVGYPAGTKVHWAIKPSNYPGLARDGSIMRKVTDSVFRFLDLLGGYSTTDQLVDMLRHEPDVFQHLGMRQRENLSSYVSRDPRFKFERGFGWRLKTPDEIAADQGSGPSWNEDQEGAPSS